MTPKQFRRKMEKINRLFNEIETTLNEIPLGLREQMDTFHNPEATILHCTRWGIIGSEEIIEAYDDVHEKASENYEL